MKPIKWISDVTLGISIILFSYVYWFSYQLEQYGNMGKSGEDILYITVNGFTVAFLLSVTSAIFRGVEIKRMKEPKLRKKILLAISLVPSIKILIGYIIYGVN